MLDFFCNNYIYMLLPLISGLIGWITNVIAIKMTFYPIEYKGIKPLGWQGIIPSKTKKMAEKSVDLLTRDLFKTSEVFARIDTKKVEEISHDEFLELAKKITERSLTAKIPALWKIATPKFKATVTSAIAKQIPYMLAKVMEQIKNDIDNILDLKKLAWHTLKEDKTLINRIFLDMGAKQFRFIEISGLWLGMLFGIGQIFTAMYINHWLVYLLYGIFIGYITNVIAIKMIFEPAEPKYIGPIKLQGLFLKNQKEEAYRYAQIIADNILTVENLFDAIFRMPNNSRVNEILKTETAQLLKNAEEDLPLGARLTLIGELPNYLKSVAVYELQKELPVTIRTIFPYAEKALDIKNDIYNKMSSLPPRKFIDFLRPAFQEDEWKLIAVGSILGGIAGILQYFLV